MNQEANPETAKSEQKPLNVTLPKAWRFPHANDWTILSLPATLYRNHQVVMTGINIKADKEGYLVVVKAESLKGPVVSFSGGRCFEDAIEVLCYEAAHGTMTFKPDRYA